MGSNRISCSFMIVMVVSSLVVQSNQRFLQQGKNEELVPRIYNGWVATNGEFPWNMALVKNNYPFCGSALITTKTALSAAHCIYDENTKEIEGRIGDVDLRKAKVVSFHQLIPHKEFNNATLVNDIALVILREEIELSDRIKTIALPPKSKYFTGKAMVAGWGINTNKTIFFPEMMQWVDMDIVPVRWCKKSFDNPLRRDTAICVTAENKGPVNGDSGTSLIYRYGDQMISIGVMRGGDPRPGKLDDFIQTSLYADWISETAVGKPEFVK